MAKAYEELLNIEIGLNIIVDSKDLYTTLSTCKNSIDRSIRGDVSVIRYEFEAKNITAMSCIPGKTNLADAYTKQNSPLVQPLQNILHESKIDS